MANDTVNQLIESKQFSAAIRSIEAGGQAASGLDTAQAEKLIRHLMRQGQLDKSASLAESYLATNPDDAKIHFLLGNVVLKLGDVNRAMKALDESNRLQPNNVITLANLAVGYNTLDQHGDAVEVLEQALKLNPQYAFAYQKLGSILCKAEGFVRFNVP